MAWYDYNEREKLSDVGVQMIFMGAAAVLAAGILFSKQAAEDFKREYRPVSQMNNSVLKPRGCGDCALKVTEPY